MFDFTNRRRSKRGKAPNIFVVRFARAYLQRPSPFMTGHGGGSYRSASTPSAPCGDLSCSERLPEIRCRTFFAAGCTTIFPKNIVFAAADSTRYKYRRRIRHFCSAAEGIALPAQPSFPFSAIRSNFVVLLQEAEILSQYYLFNISKYSLFLQGLRFEELFK